MSGSLCVSIRFEVQSILQGFGNNLLSAAMHSMKSAACPSPIQLTTLQVLATMSAGGKCCEGFCCCCQHHWNRAAMQGEAQAMALQCCRPYSRIGSP